MQHEPIHFDQVKPEEIEARSFEIIRSELPHPIPEELAPIILRVIHSSADFEYADSLYISEDALSSADAAIRSGHAHFITDTQMALGGINQIALDKLGAKKSCFMSDPDVRERAKAEGVTRARVSMDKAAEMPGPLILAIGNAPTALIRICELIEEGRLSPALVIGAPVGFVNVIQAKEYLMRQSVPQITARGRKGGSSVAAAICNALIYRHAR